jgi:hypothetical protein
VSFSAFFVFFGVVVLLFSGISTTTSHVSQRYSACDFSHNEAELSRFSQLFIAYTLDLIYGNRLYTFFHGHAVVPASLCHAIL